jgi:hypothetical protein
MSIQIREVKQIDYESLAVNFEKEIPLWLLPKFITCYKEKMLLVAYRGNRLVGLWVVPISITEGQKIAQREYRYLPYSSPYLFEQDNLKRREVVYGLFKYLTENCNKINLPFDPGFKDFAPIQGLGALVEWRHTHVIKAPFEYQKMSSRLRNHIRSAKKLVKIEFSKDQSKFNFDEAIKGLKKEQQARRELAINLLRNNQAIIVTAYKKKKICSGILIALDANTAYMLHSWQAVDAPRGTVSALILEAVNWAISEKRVKQYDFEGSVLQKIDYYYSGFNCEISPYGHVFWSKDQDELFGLIQKSINIPGRLI